MAQANLVMGWIWILAGFLFGLYLGMNFHREEWMGGYQSLKRRMYRLSHISFFGLAIINLLFAFTVRIESLNGPLLPVASLAFLVGALTMPICCIVMAYTPRFRMLFGIPVTALVLAAGITIWEVSK